MKIAPKKPTLKIDGILAHGYFPPELPPPFSTNSFAAVISKTKPTSLPVAFTKEKNEWCDLVTYSLSTPGSLRRRLAVVNPVAYYRLVEFIVANQTSLLRRVAASHISLAPPVIGLNGQLKRSKRFDAVPLQRAVVRLGEEFLLIADISRFYPSIYTHAIEWAISSKARAKRQLKTKTKKPSLGRTLDRLVQACQSGQTRGIPIGPSASMLLSELLLAKVDARLKARKIIHGFRYADDYELTFDSRAQAERALASLEDALAEFELELNPAKTGIDELPQDLDNPGIQELRKFHFRKRYQAHRSDLMHFFTRAFALQRAYPDKAILRYAVSRLPIDSIAASNADLCQKLVLQAVAHEPGVWAIGINRLLRLHATHPSQTTDDIAAVIHAMIRNSAHLNHSSEVAWAIWAALAFKIQLSSAAVKSVVAMLDDCCCLLLLDAASQGLTATKPQDSSIRRWFSPEALRGPHWLLSYEAPVQGWVVPNKKPDHIALDPTFEFLRQNYVRFYDTSMLTKVRTTAVQRSQAIKPQPAKRTVSKPKPVSGEEEKDEPLDVWLGYPD